ncbi:MAG: hypothetical protein ACJAXA_001004, partial [Candidatus Aldehydirespiratoraceae bacterium]
MVLWESSVRVERAKAYGSNSSVPIGTVVKVSGFPIGRLTRPA